MKKLTKRERILLSAAFVLYMGFFCWQILILPARKRLLDARQRELQLTELLKDSWRTEAGEPEAENGIRLTEGLETEQVDRLIQRLALDTGMEPRFFQAGEAEDVQEDQLIKSLIRAELWGPDFSCAQAMTERIGEGSLPIVLERVQAAESEDGVELYLELSLYGRKEEAAE